MLKRVLAVAGAAAALSVALVAPASAAGELCYDIQANINGTPVSQAACTPIG